MLLRTGSTLATLQALRNIQIPKGRDFRFTPPPLDLLAADLAAGLTLVEASLVVSDSFGGTVRLTKSITTVANPAAGQITDNAATDGHGGMYFQLSPSETTLGAGKVFEVIVYDSRGQQSTFDAGAFVASATASAASGATAAVTIDPARVSMVIGVPVGLTAQPVDALGAPVLGQTVTWQSSNPAIVTVAADGTLSGIAGGSATITATVQGVQGSCAVTVQGVSVGIVFDGAGAFG